MVATRLDQAPATVAPVAIEPRAAGHAVKPGDTSNNRIASTASDAVCRTARSSPAARTKFFVKCPHTADPRDHSRPDPLPLLRTLRAVLAHVPGTDEIVHAGSADLPPCAGNAAANATTTNVVLPAGTPRCSTVTTRAPARRSPRSPSAGNDAYVACADPRLDPHHGIGDAHGGSREVVLPGVKPRGGADYPVPRRLLIVARHYQPAPTATESTPAGSSRPPRAAMRPITVLPDRHDAPS